MRFGCDKKWETHLAGGELRRVVAAAKCVDIKIMLARRRKCCDSAKWWSWWWTFFWYRLQSREGCICCSKQSAWCLFILGSRFVYATQVLFFIIFFVCGMLKIETSNMDDAFIWRIQQSVYIIYVHVQLLAKCVKKLVLCLFCLF